MPRPRAASWPPAAGATRSVRITRDPVRRLVSIFRHVCRQQFLQGALDASLGLDTGRDGVSLQDLDRYLTGRSLTVPCDTDFHVCAQYHPIWDAPFDRVVTVNLDEMDLNTGLNGIEAALGLPLTRFDEIEKFEQLRQAKYARNRDYSGAGPLEAHRFLPTETIEFPKRDFERLGLVREMALRHHQIDFGRVASGDTAVSRENAM